MHKAIYAASIILMIVIGGPGNNYTIYRTYLSDIKYTLNEKSNESDSISIKAIIFQIPL